MSFGRVVLRDTHNGAERRYNRPQWRSRQPLGCGKEGWLDYVQCSFLAESCGVHKVDFPEGSLAARSRLVALGGVVR